jgi:hypothetical protein
VLSPLATYTLPVLWLTAISRGTTPTGILAITSLVGDITETAPTSLPTYTLPLLALTTTVNGLLPTGIVAMTESAQALSTPNRVLDDASVIANVRINVQETACWPYSHTISNKG